MTSYQLEQIRGELYLQYGKPLEWGECTMADVQSYLVGWDVWIDANGLGIAHPDFDGYKPAHIEEGWFIWLTEGFFVPIMILPPKEVWK